ncbi:hypothetical protein BOSEA31B_20148 [Hyphomicrobiales bacterium]|nr:hypothetical protein BOSEA31B_20148 [Hyphomicrobiales bacterium]CAH1702480.1 hypothetical protein BOSEA1005_30352 [Hyphomicrobiales bacterium]CAI0346681.1 hypothetical protein BO1005MUT1_520193 [Hyphomicrobiales bacterium]
MQIRRALPELVMELLPEGARTSFTGPHHHLRADECCAVLFYGHPDDPRLGHSAPPRISVDSAILAHP